MTKKNKVVTFSSHGYADLLVLWAKQSVNNIDGTTALVCLDEPTTRVAADLPGLELHGGANLTFDPKDRQTFWINRLKTILSQSEGTDMAVHSDLDAFWLKPAIPLLEGQDFDMAFSIDYALPNEIVKKWGFILCCGFFAFRPNPRTNLLTARWLAETQKYFDDQIAINRLLDSLNVTWSDIDIQGLPARRGVVRIDDQDIKLIALPWTLFPRQHPMMESPQAIVAHPYWERRFHKSFVETYTAIRETFDGLPPFDLPEFPGHSVWRPRDWAFLHILEDMATRGPLSDEQNRHLAVLSYRFGRSDRAVAILEDLIAKGHTDDFIHLDIVEATAASGDLNKSKTLLLMYVRHIRQMGVLRRCAMLGLKRGRLDILLAYSIQAASVIVQDNIVLKLAKHKLRDLGIFMRRGLRT
jgi:hypothetical protein